MTDQALLENYVRVRVTAARIFIEVRAPESEDDHLAVRWSMAATLPPAANPSHVERARLMTLADYRYFRVCEECGTRTPAVMVKTTREGKDVCVDCEGVSREELPSTPAP